MTAIGDPQVLAAHPLLIVGLSDSLQPWRADVVGETLRCSPGCVEDLDALPVEERAAIYCSMNACCHAHVCGVHLESMRVAGADAEIVALVAWRRLGDIGLESWARSESEIRTGEVRP